MGFLGCQEKENEVPVHGVRLHHDVGGLNPAARHRDVSSVHGDAQRLLVAAQDLLRQAVGRVQGSRDCILPEEDVGGVRQIFVDEDSRGRVPRHGNRSQLLEVMSHELRWMTGGG